MVAQSSRMVNPVAGAALVRPDRLRADIATLGRSWGTADPRVAGTLWWYMAASVLVEQVVRTVAAGRSMPVPALDRLECAMRPDGSVERIHVSGDAATVESEPRLLAAALRETVDALVAAVAEASGARVAALWAITADALGNRALDAGSPQVAVTLADEIGGKLPVPRFVEVEGRTFVRRVSCCLIHEVPTCRMCAGCPKRPPAERLSILRELAEADRANAAGAAMNGG